MFVANKIQLTDSPMKIASSLVGKTVRYLNQKPSSLPKNDGIRTFKVMEVADVFQSKNTNQQCVRVYVADLDVEGAPLKYRTLHVNGIKCFT